MNKKDIMLKMFKEISKEEKLEMITHRGVVVEFRDKGKSHFIYSYSFGLNPTSTSKICDNKRLAGSVLEELKISTAEHKTFKTKPNDKSFEKNKFVLKYLKEHKELICKYNDGGGGDDIYRITSQEDLKNLPTQIFEDRKDIIFSPFYKLKNEYRVIFLDGEVKLIFDKKRRYVTGDGTKTIGELMQEKNLDIKTLDKKLKKNSVPLENQKVLINWQHNLAAGAIPKIVTDTEEFKEVEALAIKTANSLNIKFASIDIARNGEKGLMILEINAGVTLNRFAERNKEHYKIAKDIYKEAIISGLI